MENTAEKESINVNVAIPTEQPAADDDGDVSRSTTIRNVQPGLVRGEVSFKIPTNEDAAAHVHHKHGQHSWQAKILNVIHAKWFQRVMIALLLMDVLILFTELFLMSLVSSAVIFHRLNRSWTSLSLALCTHS